MASCPRIVLHRQEGSVEKLNNRKPQQKESDIINKLKHCRESGQRQKPIGLSPKHNKPCSEHAQTSKRLKPNKSTTTSDNHFHRHKRKNKCLSAAMLILLVQVIGRTPTRSPKELWGIPALEPRSRIAQSVPAATTHQRVYKSVEGHSGATWSSAHPTCHQQGLGQQQGANNASETGCTELLYCSS